MATTPGLRLFGSRRRTEVLIMVALLGETFPSELARLLRAPLYSIQTIVAALDREGVLATRISGRARVVALDPRYFAFLAGVRPTQAAGGRDEVARFGPSRGGAGTADQTGV